MSRDRPRDRIEIIRDILDIAYPERILFTPLMVKSRLATIDLQRYLRFLVDRGLITRTPNNIGTYYYITTEQGHDWAVRISGVLMVWQAVQ